MTAPQFRYNPLTNRLDLSDTAGGGASGILTITGDTGGAVGGDSNRNINLHGSDHVTVQGTSVAFEQQILLHGFTQFLPVVGGLAGDLTQVAPGTLGYVLTSGGASSYPSYQALPYTKMPWTDESTSFNALSQNGYFVTANATATLPSSPAQGDEIAFAVDSASGILTVQANTGQTIQIGKAISASAGIAVSNFNGDSVTLRFRSSDSNWLSTSVVGTFTVT